MKGGHSSTVHLSQGGQHRAGQEGWSYRDDRTGNGTTKHPHHSEAARRCERERERDLEEKKALNMRTKAGSQYRIVGKFGKGFNLAICRKSPN